MTEKLNANQRKAIAALLASKSVKEAAEGAGLSSRTLFRYLADPDFRAALANEGQSLVEAAGLRLLAGQDKALDRLDDLIDNAENETNMRLAAQAWVDYCFKWRDTSIEQRLATLEEAILHERNK